MIFFCVLSIHLQFLIKKDFKKYETQLSLFIFGQFWSASIWLFYSGCKNFESFLSLPWIFDQKRLSKIGDTAKFAHFRTISICNHLVILLNMQKFWRIPYSTKIFGKWDVAKLAHFRTFLKFKHLIILLSAQKLRHIP